jgi:hypothetical protein
MARAASSETVRERRRVLRRALVMCQPWDRTKAGETVALCAAGQRLHSRLDEDLDARDPIDETGHRISAKQAQTTRISLFLTQLAAQAVAGSISRLGLRGRTIGRAGTSREMLFQSVCLGPLRASLAGLSPLWPFPVQ